MVSGNQQKSVAPARNVFSTIFIFLSLALMLLPFITTLNSFLTSIFLKFHYYKVLQDFVVPYQAKAMASVLAILPLPISVAATPKGFWLQGIFFELQWNCLGWQSLVLLIATFLTGMQGKFTWVSRAETVTIGFLGIYLINILRIMIVGLIAIFLGRTGAIIFHDFFSLLFVVLWFIFFWWFSYSYVLEETKEGTR